MIRKIPETVKLFFEGATHAQSCTAADLHTDESDVSQPENNKHGGLKDPELHLSVRGVTPRSLPPFGLVIQ